MAMDIFFSPGDDADVSVGYEYVEYDKGDRIPVRFPHVGITLFISPEALKDIADKVYATLRAIDAEEQFNA
jgi:hypothetical protein